jgi:hypothetical protein
VTRPHHALEGKVLDVFAKLRHKGRPHFLLLLPDGSRSYIPVVWTDLVTNPAKPAPVCCLIGCASDLLGLQQRVDCLLRRIGTGPASNQNSSTQERQHATTTTGAVECRTSSDPTGLPTAHAATAKSADPSLDPTHIEVGASGPGQSFTVNRKPNP